MLSIDLFSTKFERELREGAVDDLEYRRMNDLREKMEYLMQAYKKADTDEAKDAIMKRYKEYKAEREGYLKIREQQVPSKQDPFAYVKPEPRGIGDIQDPKTKMAQLAQRTKKGPLANIGTGIKAFVKGEPEPMDEQQEINPRALGVANFQRLLKANMGNIPTVSLEFIRPEENFKLDQKGLDLISDYYDGLETDQAKNYFIYRVLPSGDETLKVLKQLGWTPQQVQPTLPGIPTQGELPLQEKKKSKSDDLEAGDIKVARELQKLRAQYPGARSDVEAVARAEIDSTERSQRQLAAIRGANEKQDALLKQLVALDQEQGQEIDGLDKENNSLEQRLAQVQATNDRLQQAIGKMTGTKKAAPKATDTNVPQPVSVDAAQGGIIDVGAPVISAPVTPVDEPKEKPSQTTSPALGSMARQLKGFSNVTPLRTVKPAPASLKATNAPKVSGSDVIEHGGGIGPRQHWQDLMQEGQPQELINRYLAIDAENDVDAVRAAIQAISRDPALGANSKSRLLGQIGMIIKRHRLPIGRSYYTYMQRYMEEDFGLPGTGIPHKSVIQGYTVYFNPETKIISITRGGDSEEAAIEQARLGTVNMKTFRQAAERLIDRIEELDEAKEIATKKDFLDRRDYLLRKMEADSNPVNKQIIRAEIRKLESQAEAEGWIAMQQRLVREDSSTSSEAAERAILNRIMVAHTDLLKEFGLKKVMQAVEEVAYNVGDLPEIGTSDVSGWVQQVKQILGVPEELDEKWSAKYKKSINCANPRGFSQKAHCAGRKKK